MLGSMVTATLLKTTGLVVTATARAGDLTMGGDRSPRVRLVPFDAARDEVGDLLEAGDFDWIVNAIGVTKPHIDEAVPATIRAALETNAVFPYEVAAQAERRGQRVIQIATDGVFSGTDGSYTEDAPHDAVDVYGRTKSLGEAPINTVVHLRCSIVGPELTRGTSLLSWALSHHPGARVTAFTNHRWNGLTTYHFARLCQAIITGAAQPPSPLHVTPRDVVSKAELLGMIFEAFERSDLVIDPTDAPVPVDRSLSTVHQDSLRHLWGAAGYSQPPSIVEMVEELKRWLPAWRACWGIGNPRRRHTRPPPASAGMPDR